MKNYLAKLPIIEAILTLKVRTGMLDVKANFKNNHENILCPICKIEIETSSHLMSCSQYKTEVIHENTIKLFWGHGDSLEEINAMSKAVKTLILRLSERSSNCEVNDSVVKPDWCQEEEGTSMTAVSKDNQK